MSRDREDAAAEAVGVDIGGSGIKGALVDLSLGDFAGDRVRIPTPQPSTPEAVAAVVGEVVAAVAGEDQACALGVTFPAVVQHGVARTAANVDDTWIGTNVAGLLHETTGRHVHVVNDADAAGVAEARFGAAKGEDGVVLVTTLGTGIGTALLVDGVLVPNTELGHVEIDGQDAEDMAADSARERDDLSMAEWAARLTRYYRVIEDLIWPDLIVIGGGVSKKHEQFLHLLEIRTRVVPAELRNRAGIIGAAVLAAEQPQA